MTLPSQTVSVSSTTGDGIPAFFDAVQAAREEYLADYRPELERLAKERDEKREKKKQAEVEKLMRDMGVGGAASKSKAKQEDEEGPIIDRYEGDGQIIEPVSTITAKATTHALTRLSLSSHRMPMRRLAPTRCRGLRTPRCPPACRMANGHDRHRPQSTWSPRTSRTR